jgi:hypothetical protein
MFVIVREKRGELEASDAKVLDGGPRRRLIGFNLRDTGKRTERGRAGGAPLGEGSVMAPPSATETRCAAARRHGHRGANSHAGHAG